MYVCTWRWTTAPGCCIWLVAAWRSSLHKQRKVRLCNEASCVSPSLALIMPTDKDVAGSVVDKMPDQDFFFVLCSSRMPCELTEKVRGLEVIASRRPAPVLPQSFATTPFGGSFPLVVPAPVSR